MVRRKNQFLDNTPVGIVQKEILRHCPIHGNYNAWSTKKRGKTTISLCPSCLGLENKKNELEGREKSILDALLSVDIPDDYNKRYKELEINDENKQALLKNKRLVYGITQDNFHNIVYFGNSGSGKTQLLFSSAIEMVSLKKRVKFIEFKKLINDLYERIIHNKPINLSYVYTYVLMIDDVSRDGLEKKKLAIAMNDFFLLLNRRMDHLLPTFISTYLDQKDLKNFLGKRISESFIEDAETVFLKN